MIKLQNAFYENQLNAVRKVNDKNYRELQKYLENHGLEGDEEKKKQKVKALVN